MKIAAPIFIMTACFCAIGCGKCEKKNLSKNDIAWVSVFSLGQSFYYKSLKGNFDTLQVIDTSDRYTLCNRLELSKYQYEIYLVRLRLKSKNSYENIEPFVTVTTEDWQKSNPYIYFGNLGPHRNDLDNKIPVAIDTILNGIKFKSVYYYEKNLNTEQYGEKEYFNNFVWDKRIGLVAYTTIDGELFVRFNN